MVTIPQHSFAVDIDMIARLDIQHTAGWSHLMMTMALNGYDLDQNSIYSILFAGGICDPMHEALVDGIRHCADLDRLCGNMRFLEYVFCLYGKGQRTRTTLDLMLKLVRIIYKDQIAFYKSHTLKDGYTKLMDLLSALDARFPVLLAEFYSRYGKWLARFQPEISAYIRKIYKGRAAAGGPFPDICRLMESESLKNSKNIAFMN